MRVWSVGSVCSPCRPSGWALVRGRTDGALSPLARALPRACARDSAGRPPGGGVRGRAGLRFQRCRPGVFSSAWARFAAVSTPRPSLPGARPAPRPTRDVVRPFTLSALGDGGFRRLGCPGVPFCEVSVPSRCRPRPRTCADVLGTRLNPPVPERTGCTLFLRSAPWLSTLPATSSHEFFMSTVPGTLRGR